MDPAGTVATICVSLQLLTLVALIVPNCTNPLPWAVPKPVPVMVTGVVPGIPAVGETLVMTGGGALEGGWATTTCTAKETGDDDVPVWMKMDVCPGPTAVTTPAPNIPALVLYPTVATWVLLDA
jgi:hypothetical protein